MSEQLKKLQAEIKTMRDEWAGKDFDSEAQANWDKLNADYDTTKANIERDARVAEVEAQLTEPVIDGADFEQDSNQPPQQQQRADTPTIEDHDNAIRAWMLRQSGRDVSDDMIDSAKRCGVNINSQEFMVPRQKRTATNTSTTAALGGYSIPEGFSGQLEKAMAAWGGPRNCCTVWYTETGNAVEWPTFTDTANAGAQLAEETTVGDSLAPAFGHVTFNAYKFSSSPVAVSSEILQDSAFDVGGILAEALGRRLGVGEAAAYTTGNGSDAPNGIVTAAGTGVTTASATAIKADEIIDLIHTLDSAYRINASFMMSDAIVKYLRKLKDGEGRYLWQPGTVGGAPDTLFGYPINVNHHMSTAVTASEKVALFGDMSKYVIRDAGPIRLRRLVELYADTDQEAFIAFHRTDGDLLDAGTDPVITLLMHA